MKKIFITATFLILFSFHIKSEDIFSIKGYFKNFSSVFSLPEYKTDKDVVSYPDMGAVSNRLRIKLLIKPLTWLSINSAYDIYPIIQDTSLFNTDLFFTDVVSTNYRFNDLSKRIYPEQSKKIGSFGLFHNLDRLFITIKTNFADIFIGRQSIAWGSAHVINPTDIIAPFTFNELDIEERRGVDAIRIRIPIGIMDEIDAGYVAGENFNIKKSAFFLRSKIYILKTDFSLLLLDFKEHLLLGIDITRSIGGACFWFEAAYVIPFFFNTDKTINENNYFRASAGLDYNLSTKTYGYIEYHFNSSGKNITEEYQNNFNSSAFQDGSVYLMGKHYLNFGLTYQISPLASFSKLIIYNINDKSFYFAPKIEYNIAENIYLSAGSFFGIGKKPEIIPNLSDKTPYTFHSEFGTYPGMFFLSFRIYF